MKAYLYSDTVRRSATAILLLLVLEYAHSAIDPYPVTNLVAFAQRWEPKPEVVGLVCKLDPEWVGTVKRLYPAGAEEGDHIRFSHLAVWANKYRNPNTNFIVLRGRIASSGKLGSHLGSEGPIYAKHLPTTDEILKAKTFAEMEKLLGPADFADCCPFVAGWSLCTLNAVDQLRYLNVFVECSTTGVDQPKPVVSRRVREGIFRPADPNSAEERGKFKTGEEMHAEREAARAKEREKYPRPLRDLVAARQTPDDSALVTYYRALHEVRRNPSRKLFQQFAEWIHEGTREVSLMLDTLLFEKSLEPWTESNRLAATRNLVDVLPYVKSGLDLQDLIACVLKLRGGGEFKLRVPGSNAVVDIKADDGSFSSGSQNIDDLVLTHVAMECAKALRERYPELRRPGSGSEP
jgi:hypothetical protein